MRVKKLIIVVSILVMVLLVASGTATTVWALTTQTGSTKIRVAYTARNIGCEIMCNKYFGSDDNPEFFDSGLLGKTIVQSNSSITNVTLQPSQTSLNDDNSYVVYEFNFKNLSSTSYYMSVMTYSGDVQGLNFYALSRGDKINGVYSNAKGSVINISATAPVYFFLAPEVQDTYLYIVIEKKSSVASCQVMGNFECSISCM